MTKSLDGQLHTFEKGKYKMENAICVKYWCDWAMLKKLVSQKSVKVMDLVEYKEMTDDAMGIMRKMAGPLTIAEVDTFISDELLDELENPKKYAEFIMYGEKTSR